jgi:hypothetical protein
MIESNTPNTLDELRRRQLSRLKGELHESTEPPAIQEPLDDEYASYAARQEAGNWPVQDRETWETEHRAWLERQRDRKQPENKPEPKPFQVGQATDEWYPRAAIPRPQWPEPGAPLTREVERAYNAEHDLYQRANRALQDVTWWTRTRLNEPDFWNDAEQNRYAQTLAWLMGIWQGRKIQPPTEAELETWAREWDREIKKSSRTSQKQNEPEPS